jgi:transcriptional regulator of met regulon
MLDERIVSTMLVRRLAALLPVSVRNYLWETRFVTPYKHLLKHTAELKTISVETPMSSVEMLVLPGGVIDREVARQGTYEPLLVESFCEAVTPSTVVYDVGAQFGYFTTIARELGVPGERIHAFEPDVLHRHVLERNHESDGVHVSPKLVADIVDDSRTTLDRYAAQTSPPDVVKIDVEGGEFAVVRGMRETCTRHRPTIFCEMHPALLPAAVTPDDVYDLLEEYGYELSVASHRQEGERWHALSEASPPSRTSYLVRATPT